MLWQKSLHSVYVALLSVLVWNSVLGGGQVPGKVSDEARLFYAMGYLDGRASALPDLARLLGIKESDPRFGQLDLNIELAKILEGVKNFYAKKGNERVPLRQVMKSVLTSMVSGGQPEAQIGRAHV